MADATDDQAISVDNNANDIDAEQMIDGESLVPQQPEDGATPFSDPTDPIADASSDLDSREQNGQLDPTSQLTDSASDIDSQQRYDEGLAGAAEASEPNASNTVVGYHPESDQRLHPDISVDSTEESVG